MINTLLSFLAPHYCWGCAKVGTTLCQNCKYDIVEEAFDACIVCGKPSSVGICNSCHSTYERAWCVGERSDILKKIINAYKFDRAVDASTAMASLLDLRLPLLPAGVVVVPVPTVPAHIRQRGYDHTLLLARKFAKARQLPVRAVLERNDTHMQRGKNRRVRFAQAKVAFGCSAELDPAAIYLLVDDVVTTNATLSSAASVLLAAGATNVWVAAIARQPLDKGA